MKTTTSRLLVSLGLSVACAAGTHAWYRSHTGAFSADTADEPVARLLSLKNEVQRKSSHRLIWKSLASNESLFANEQVRTREDSSALIEFLDSQSVVEVEPQSLITIEKSEDGLVLDFVEGAVLVRSETSESGLAMKVDGKSYRITGASLGVAKGPKGETEILVHKGQVSGVEAPKSTLKALSPLPNARVSVAPDSQDVVTWRWQQSGQDAAKSRVQLEIGPSRSQMRLSEAAKDTGDSEKSLKLLPGEYYWRLVAQASDGRAAVAWTPTYRLRVLPKRAPVALGPALGAKIAPSTEGKGHRFEWANPGRLSQVLLEVAQSKDLKKGYRQVVVRDRDWVELPLSDQGAYYWRVTGYLSENGEPISTPLQQFEVSGSSGAPSGASVSEEPVAAREPAAVTKPLLIAPVYAEFVTNPLVSGRNGQLNLSWHAVPEAKAYEVELVDARGHILQTRRVEKPEVVLEKLRPGRFALRVVAIDPFDRKGFASEALAVVVPEFSDAQAPKFKALDLE